jgi:hypothetical protein
MKNALVRVFFEPIWSIVVLPLFFMSTAFWDFARFLVGSPDLQESAKKGKRSPKSKEEPRNHHFRQRLQKGMEHSRQEMSKLEPEFL